MNCDRHCRKSKTGSDPVARCLTNLLSEPTISWSTCDGEMNHALRTMFDNEKQE
jgi:hypothetical protein